MTHAPTTIGGLYDSSPPILSVHHSNGIAIRLTFPITSQSAIHRGLIRSGNVGTNRLNFGAPAVGSKQQSAIRTRGRRSRLRSCVLVCQAINAETAMASEN